MNIYLFSTLNNCYVQVQKAVNKALEQYQQANPPASSSSSSSSSSMSPSAQHVQKLESLNMELQELLNTTAAALVDTARKHEDARAEIDAMRAERNAMRAEIDAERTAMDAELHAHEREADGLRWQLASLQKRADESFAVQDKMRFVSICSIVSLSFSFFISFLLVL